MIGILVKKDFLTNLVSPRFVIGFVLCLVLIPFSILDQHQRLPRARASVPDRPGRR